MPNEETESAGLSAENAPNRLSSVSEEVIDRSQTLRFEFNGKSIPAHPGDTIGSALAAAGVKVISRSFKYHRPRGMLCCAGQCPNCLVQVADEPNVRACRRQVEAGMSVKSQNVWPSLETDALSITKFASAFMPVGFYYKTFIRPKALWPYYEEFIRHAAGLGKVDKSAKHGKYDKQYLHAEVVVIGGGPSGISAAIAAADQGASVLLFDENPQLGGHLRFTADRGPKLEEIRKALDSQAGVTVYRDTTVVGGYQDRWIAAVQGNRLFKIRAESVVMATGAIETPLMFDNNDLPGVMLGSAVQRLMKLYGVAPGRRALIVTANEDGWVVARELHAAGVAISAVVDERADGKSSAIDTLRRAEVPIHFRHTIAAARGSGEVRGASIVGLDAEGNIDSRSVKSVNCDLISVSMGWTPDNGLVHMLGGSSEFDETMAESLPTDLPEGIYTTGRIEGAQDVDTEQERARMVGNRAAAFTGHGVNSRPLVELPSRIIRTSDRVAVPGKQKQFLCYCEDVTGQDLQTAIVEGYDSVELLKRYSTISMGPCQGKMCSRNALHLCARVTDRSVGETGRTTTRPPVSPVPLGVLAGQNMEPVQVTPVHQWHVDRNAKMMVAGLWMRPEHYGDPVAEVMAVRERVGLMDVSTLGKIQLTGPGVPDLLERVYINQWQNLRVGRVRYGVMCNDEGVVMDDGVCARAGDEEWYMTTTSSGATSIYQWLQWWAQSGWGEDVHIKNVTENYAAFNLAGPKARGVLQTLTRRDLSDGKFAYMRMRTVRVAGVLCRILRIGFTGELSYEIHCPSGFAAHVWDALMAAGESTEIVPFGVEAQRVLRLEKGHIIVGQDTDAMTDPLSADMAWAVKLEKNDFLGKPSLVRLSRSERPQRLVGFTTVDPEIVPEEGLQIVETDQGGKHRSVGWVTSSRFSHTLGKTIGLCWLPTEVASVEGNRFVIRREGEPWEASVHHGPFYDPQGERLRM